MLKTYIGRRIREKRLKENLTLSDIAHYLNLSHQQVQKYERAQSSLSAATLYRLSQILKVDPSYFFKGFDLFQLTQENQKKSPEIIVMNRQAPLNVLLIDDHIGEEHLIRQAFMESGVDVNLFTIRDGESALAYLRNPMTNVNCPRPDLILLGFELKQGGGLSLLRDLKRDRHLNDIPVIVLTSSVCFSQMVACYRAQASSYIHRSFCDQDFQKKIAILAHYWSQAMVLPNRARGHKP